ncbi:MAG: zinc ribbon domain-containing protein [Desulfobacterales bacterium]|nr:zinc ribbon domain-containing protein [Desulfobacterales bacterium]
MPIYEYTCERCGKEFECLVFQSDDRPECPDCNCAKVNRVMSTCGFVSKGSGGEPVKRAAATSGCSSCAASSCAGCGH